MVKTLIMNVLQMLSRTALKCSALHFHMMSNTKWFVLLILRIVMQIFA